jgi:pimeloyl-ACP methyl ester carboxylesterase
MDHLINGLKVFIEGDSKNQAIIFIHGFPYDHTMWDSQIDALKEKYFCITYDIRGLGKSYVGDGQFTMEAFVWDLYSIMDELHIEKPILCGLSMGGYISLRAIEKEHNRFAGLILCDSRSEADNNDGKIVRSTAIDKVNVQGVGAFVSEFVPKCFHPKTPERLTDMYDRIFTIAKNQNSVGVKGSLLAMLSRRDTTPSLKNIEIPTLILVGKKDALTPPKTMKKIAKKIKNSEFFRVPKSGHMTPLENPAFVNERILEYLEKHFCSSE